VGQPEYFRCMYEHDLDGQYDVQEFTLGWYKETQYYRSLIKFDPDVVFFFRPECYPQGLLESLGGIKVALSSEPIPKHIMGRFLTSADMWGRFESLKGAKSRFDFFFHYDKTSLRFLREQGFRVDGEFLFPVATGLYRPLPSEKRWDWGFFGRDTPYRESYLGVAKRDFNGLHVAHGIFGEEYVRLMNQCKIGVNIHVDSHLSLEHRMHNMMACGVMVMSEPLSHNDLMKPGVHYVEFSEPKEFWEKLEYYLKHDGERDRIAARGLELVRKELNAQTAFARLIERVVSAAKPMSPRSQGTTPPAELSSDVQTASERSQTDSGVEESLPPYSFVRLNRTLSGGLPQQRGRLTRWRNAVDRLMPYGTRRRTAYTRVLRTIKRRLGNEQRPLADLLSERWGKGGPRISTCKEGLRSILKTSAQRLGLPADAPSILIILPSQSISGGTMVLCEHANRLIARGYNVLLVDNLLAGIDRYRLDWFPDLKPMVIPISRIEFDGFVDVAVATHWSTASAAIEMPARRHWYFVQADETKFHPAGSLESQLARETYTMEFQYLVIAQWLQRWLRDQFGKPAVYIPNAVDEKRFYPDEPLHAKGNKLRVLLEGSIADPRKGMEDAFLAVQDLDCEVWCVSSIGKPKRKWHCDRFFESVPYSKMRRIYSSCDVLLKMSRAEGFFLPPLEMMACGGTVVTGKVTGHDEYIVDGYNGLVVDQGDVAGARDALQRLAEDRCLLDSLRVNGLQTATQWRWDRSSEILHNFLLEDLGRIENTCDDGGHGASRLSTPSPLSASVDKNARRAG
jgi:glycosyltransferase involved in cell wall biosynthesis